MKLISRLLAKLDELIDGLDVFAPGSRVTDHEEGGGPDPTFRLPL